MKRILAALVIAENAVAQAQPESAITNFLLALNGTSAYVSVPSADDLQNPTETRISPANRPDPSASLYFAATGATFAPMVVVSNGAAITWTFWDGTTSSSTSPVKNYGSATLRTNWLQVKPWSALAVLNAGFDGGDAPDYGGFPISFSPTSITNEIIGFGGCLSNAYNLAGLALSYSTVPYLDLSACTNLIDVEVFDGGLTNVNVSTLTKALRLCFENNYLQSLDLSGCRSLGDLRSATQHSALPTITWGGPKTNEWHICTRDNAFTSNQPYNVTEFPMVEELWIWDDQQTGSLEFAGCTTLMSALVYANNYGRINFTNCTALSDVECFSDPSLTNLLVAGCSSLGGVIASNCALTADSVNGVLTSLSAIGNAGGTCDLSGGNNSWASGAGLTAYTNLVANGWAVILNWNTNELPTFAPTACTIQANQFGFTISGPSGVAVVTEASTNLTDPTWLPLATNTLTSGSCYFSDSQWTNYPSRFYRLRWP